MYGLDGAGPCRRAGGGWYAHCTGRPIHDRTNDRPMDTALPIVTTSNPHHVRFGGHDAVVRLVDAFYRAMDTRPEAGVIRAMHEPDLGPTKAVLVSYLDEWMGGPKHYSTTRGAPMLRRRHRPFDIDAGARDAWMACMRQALAETCDDAALRVELEAAFLKVAEAVRNTVDGPATPIPTGPDGPSQPGAPR